MLKQLARYAGQGNRTIITGKRPVPLFEQGANVRKRPFTRDFTSISQFVEKDGQIPDPTLSVTPLGLKDGARPVLKP